MWTNQQCAIDHWGDDCRDVTTTKLQCRVQRLEVIVKMKKIKWGGGGVREMCTKNGSYCEKEKNKKTKRYGHMGGVGEAFVKSQNKIYYYFFFFFFGGGRVRGRSVCERRSEAS